MSLNFARAPFRNERLPRTLFVLAVLAVTGATILHGVVLTRYLLREREELDEGVSELRLQLNETNGEIARAERALSAEQTSLGNEQTRFLVRLYRQKGFSWTGLFNELETIMPGPVRITSIAPFEEDGRISVTLTLVGRTLQDVLEMVRQLEASSFFATVFPLDESNLDELGAGDTGIAATLRLDYVEPSSEPEPEEGSVP